jgi:hypothetical protein
MPDVSPFSAENGETRSIFPRQLCLVLALYAAVFVAYAVTWSFTEDEGYHLLAAQLIASGKTPYIDFCFPQTPLNAYWNALWMRVLGGNWHVPHLLAALFTVCAVVLTADYVVRRFPICGWRTDGAIAAALMLGLNGVVFIFGSLQAYGICLFGVVAAFRLTTLAVDRPRWLTSAAAGLFAGIAAASSLLSAAVAPVLLLWIVFCNCAGNRWQKSAGFILGMFVPFTPVFWIFVRGPRQTWFNLFRYHVFFRRLYWPETTQHDLEVLTTWIDSGQALILGLLALGGLLYVVRQSGWLQTLKAEFYLCAWLALALAVEISWAHPTFTRYFLLTVPFLAILAVPGLFAVSRAFEVRRSLSPMLLLTVFLALGLGKALYDRREFDNWYVYERLAAKVDQVTPPNVPILAVERIYFLTKRVPPPGYELSYTHLVNLPAEEAALMHILNEAAVKRQAQSGMFATAYSCDEKDIDDLGWKTLYKQHAELEGCTIFWDPRKGWNHASSIAADAPLPPSSGTAR